VSYLYTTLVNMDQSSNLSPSQWSSQFSQQSLQSLPSIGALGLASSQFSTPQRPNDARSQQAPQSPRSQQSPLVPQTRGRGRGRGVRARGGRNSESDGQRGRHWSEQKKRDLLDILWIHAQAYNRVSSAQWYRRIQRQWKQKTGHEHTTLKRRVESMVEERRRAWQLRTETSGTENETDYTVSMDRFIREVWQRAEEENSAALLTAEALRHQSRRTERDRERMTARGTQQRAINEISDDDSVSQHSGIDLDEFETGSVNSEPEVASSSARRGRGGSVSQGSSVQRRQRGGSYHGSSTSSRSGLFTQEEAMTELVTVARALATPQVAPIAELLELRTEVSELKGAIQRQEAMLAQILERQQQPAPQQQPQYVPNNWYNQNPQNWPNY
jgi:hypothetical protein